ncbi:MAG: DMT family transporter [Kiloniellales bacterium]
MSRTTWAKLAALYGGLLWGTFWVPVRELDGAGVEGLWAVALIYFLASLFALPIMLLRWQQTLRNGWRQHMAGCFLGLGMALYATAFLYTEVATAVLLYYLAPVWGFLLARVVLGDPITPVRWISMGLALVGASVILGGESWPPLPNNIGDWLALSSGVVFVIGSLMMLCWPKIAPLDYALSFLTWGGCAMLIAALVVEPQLPAQAAVTSALPWLLAFVLLGLIPGGSAAIYGATILNPGLVSIIFMSEIGVSIFLAAILTDEPFGLREIAGIFLIALAGVIEGLLDLWRRRRRAMLC